MQTQTVGPSALTHYIIVCIGHCIYINFCFPSIKFDIPCFKIRNTINDTSKVDEIKLEKKAIMKLFKIPLPTEIWSKSWIFAHIKCYLVPQNKKNIILQNCFLDILFILIKMDLIIICKAYIVWIYLFAYLISPLFLNNQFPLTMIGNTHNQSKMTLQIHFFYLLIFLQLIPWDQIAMSQLKDCLLLLLFCLLERLHISHSHRLRLRSTASPILQQRAGLIVLFMKYYKNGT